LISFKIYCRQLRDQTDRKTKTKEGIKDKGEREQRREVVMDSWTSLSLQTSTLAQLTVLKRTEQVILLRSYLEYTFKEEIVKIETPATD